MFNALDVFENETFLKDLKVCRHGIPTGVLVALSMALAVLLSTRSTPIIARRSEEAAETLRGCCR